MYSLQTYFMKSVFPLPLSPVTANLSPLFTSIWGTSTLRLPAVSVLFSMRKLESRGEKDAEDMPSFLILGPLNEDNSFSFCPILLTIVRL